MATSIWRRSVWGGLGRIGGGRPGTRSASFTPYQPPAPPSGSYDPALDAQRGAAGRGLLDLTQDIGTQNLRDTVDYGLQQGDINRGRTRGLEDIGTERAGVQRGYDRGIGDLRTDRTRGDEDYQRNIQTLVRNYERLGGQQGQAIRAAGVMRGGAALQAAAKRAENQAIERQPIDTGYNRFVADNTQAQTRLGEDRDTSFAGLDRAQTRLGDDSDTALGRLALQMAPPDAGNPFGGRAFQDRSTQLVRGQRENAAFGLDLNAQRYFQAAGSGWVPPGRGEPGGVPSNEFTDPRGNPYRVIRRGRQTIGVSPSGAELWRRRRA